MEPIVDAGRYAPSGGNSQNAHCVVILNQEVLADLAASAQVEFARMEIAPAACRFISSDIQKTRGSPEDQVTSTTMGAVPFFYSLSSTNASSRQTFFRLLQKWISLPSLTMSFMSSAPPQVIR